MSIRNLNAEGVAFGAFLLLPATLAIQKPSVIALSAGQLTATDIVFPLVLLGLMFALVQRRRKFQWHPVFFLFAAYVSAFVVASLFAPDRSRAFIKTSATLYLVLIAVATIEFVDTARRLKIVVLVFLAAAAVPLLIGLAVIAIFYLDRDSTLLPILTYHYGSVPVGNYPRLSSTFASASMFCNYLNVVLGLLMIAYAKNWIGDRYAVPAFAATAICAVFTISSGLGAIFLALGLWYWFSRPGTAKGRSALLGGCAAAILFLAFGFVALQKHSTAPYSFQIPFVDIEAYPSPRMMVWSESVNNFLGNYAVGTGPGTRSAGVTFQNTEGTYSLLTDAHNTFLSVATQTGLPGLVAILALVIYLLKIGFRPKGSQVRFGLAAAFLTAFVIQGLTSSFEDGRHLWFLIGLLVAGTRLENEGLSAEFGSSA